MNHKGNRGILLFLIAMAVYAGVVLMSWYTYQQDTGREAGWAKLEAAQARLLLRTFMFLRPLAPSDSAADDNDEMLSDILTQASDSWGSALHTRPDDVEIRFALAVCQMEFDVEAAITTILAAPPPQQKTAEYLALQALVLDPTPDPEILRQPEVMEFINRNPAKRLWLASIYSRLDKEEQAQEQWNQGYRESAPYAIASFTILGAWWGLVPLVGLICALTLIRRKRSSPADVPVSPVPAPPSSEQPQQSVTGISLGQASGGFLMWLVLSFLITGLVVEILLRLGLGRFNAPAMMICSFLAAILTVFWLRVRTRQTVSVGWKVRPFGLHLRVGLAIFLLSPIGMGLARLLQDYLDRDFREPSVLLIAGGGPLLLRILLLLAACVIVPVAEETVFRGLLFRGIRSRWGLLAGIVVSSAIFAIGHMDIVAALPLFIFSLGLAWSVERTGSLVPAAIAHGLFNLFPLLLLNVMTL